MALEGALNSSERITQIHICGIKPSPVEAMLMIFPEEVVTGLDNKVGSNQTHFRSFRA